MILGASGLKRVKDSSQKLRNYSKEWNPGDTMRVIFPVCQINSTWEIVAGGVWGHKVNDFEGIGLKSTFLPSLTQFDENGTPVGRPDVTYQFANIAQCFVDGMYHQEEAALLAKNFPSEASRIEALSKLKHKYDTKNNQKAIKPAVSRATFFITTEVLSIKMLNGAPVLDSANVVSFPLSSQRIEQLYMLLNNPKFAPVEGDTYWEIEISYPTNSDKGESGRAALPVGLTTEFRLRNQFADTWKQLEGKLSVISTDSDTIVRRATRSVSEDKIRGALSQYCLMNSQHLDNAPEESIDQLVKNASVVKELGFLRTLSNMELVDKLKAEFDVINSSQPALIPEVAIPAPDLGAMANAPTPAPAPVVPEPAPAPAPAVPDLGATTIPELNPSAPTLNNIITPNAMLQNPNIAPMSDDELENVNLDMM